MPVVLVTGASQGIGAAIAQAFSKEPDIDLVLVARNEGKLNDVARSCAEARSVLVKPCDVTDAIAVSSMADEVLVSVGPPDLLVNNAGLFRPGGILETTVDEFREQVEVNLTSAFLVTRAFLGQMVDRQSGMVVFMASVASLKAYPGGGAYCASKHGLLGLARVVREETREKGIRVTTVLPGATWTPSWEGSGNAPERMMPAGDIAAAIRDVFLLSDRTVVEEIVLRPQLGDL